MSISAGELNQRITIQNLAELPDTGGGAGEDWVTFATVWANIAPLTGRERYVAQQIEGVASMRIKIRYRAGITNKMRAVKGSMPKPDKIYAIHTAYDPDGKRAELIMLADEVKE